MEERRHPVKSSSQHDVYTHPSHVEHWRHVVEIAALTIAALWGFYVFVYQERIKPAHEPPAVDVTQTLRHAPMRGGKEFVWIELPFRNIGSVGVQFLGVIINAYGLRFSDQERTFESHARFATVIKHTLQEDSPTLLATSLLRYAQIGGQSRFGEDPGQVRKARLYFAVPSGKYDAVRLDFAYCFTRVDNRTMYPFEPEKTRNGAFDTDAFRSLNSDEVSCAASANEVFPL